LLHELIACEASPAGYSWQNAMLVVEPLVIEMLQETSPDPLLLLLLPPPHPATIATPPRIPATIVLFMGAGC
jgi:hypothetical protein